METKQIIAILVIAAVAAAAVGGAYAYTATLQNEGNSAPAQYLAISVPEESRTAEMYSKTFALDELYFDTLTKWNSTDSKQNITYAPKGGSPMPVFGFDASSAALADAGIINALQVGETLIMTVDSGLMKNYNEDDDQDWEYYQFCVNTQIFGDDPSTPETTEVWYDKALNSADETRGSIYWLVYSVNGVYSFIDMDEAEKIIFTSDIASEDTLVTVAIFAQETVSENPIPNEYMSYKDVRFTFTAEVPENASVKTDIVNGNDKTITVTTTGSSEAADMVLIVDSAGSGYFMQPTTEYTSASEIYTIGANEADAPYTVKALYVGQIWYSADPKADISSTAATVTFEQCGATTLEIVNAPNCGYTEVAAGAPLDLTGIVLEGTFTYGTTPSTVYIYFSAEDIGLESDSKTLTLTQGDDATTSIFDEGKLVDLEAGKTYDKLKISFGTVSTVEFSIVTAS